MPLPPDSTLALLPHTNPGELGHSKPKQAMIVRLSADTLDALQSYNGDKPLLDFEFADIPGIHIGSTFYPMRPLKEDAPHELYLRITSANKPSTSVKHYANVTGKFTVDREIGENITGKLREKASDAAKQRDERRTIFIDAPPPPPPTNPKKRKDHASTMFRNTVRPADQARLNAAMSSSAAPARVPSPAPPKTNTSDASAHMRKRLVHFLAVSERPRDMIVKMVAGADCDTSTRRELLQVLEEVGELTSPMKRGEDLSTKVWRLKTEAWKEVRPFEWKLQEKERLALSRTGKQKLHSLGIKPSDPLWEHFEYRASPNNAVAESSSAKESETKAAVPSKRGVSSKEVKEKKARPKSDPNADIPMKDEAGKATVDNNNTRESNMPAISKVKAPAAGRKFPGSGFKMGKTPPTGRESSDSPASSSISKSGDVRSGPTPVRFPAPVPSPNAENGKAAAQQRIQKTRELGMAIAGTDSDVEKASEGSKDKGKGRGGKAQVEQGLRADVKETASHKRKQDDDSDPTASKSGPQKKRKTDNTIPAAQRNKEVKTRDSSQLKKPELHTKEPSSLPRQSPLPKIKKEPPVNTKVSEITRDANEPSSSQRTRTDTSRAGTSKPRRKSPIYTSSSDEGEIRRPKRESPVGPLPTPPLAMNPPSVDSTQSSGYIRQRPPRESKPLPTEHAALRARYKSTYGEYLIVYQKVWTQRGKIQNLLDRGDGYGSMAESDGGDLMDSEDLNRLSSDYQRLHEELIAMRAKFDKHAD